MLIDFRNEFFNQLKALNQRERIQILLSACIGLVICLVASAIVNAVLVEISISLIFSAYFGFCFILIGVLLLMRVNSLPENSILKKKRPFLLFFSGLVLFSGAICFFLERDWNRFLTPHEKIPFYVVLGISLNFSLIFSLLDILNFTIGLFQKSWQRTMVETPNQIISVLFLSTIMGFIYGMIFGIMDIEDIKNFYRMSKKLMIEEHYCMPIAGFLGFIGGLINEYLRIRGNFTYFKFEEVNDPFQEEI